MYANVFNSEYRIGTGKESFYERWWKILDEVFVKFWLLCGTNLTLRSVKVDPAMSSVDSQRESERKIIKFPIFPTVGEATVTDEVPLLCGFSLNNPAKVSRTGSTSSESSRTEKLRNALKFKNPGPMLEEFNPDTSRREMRKLKRLVQKDPANRNKRRQRQRRRPQKQIFHDRSGVRMSDGRDVCDCQDTNCPGCHFPCPSCGSEKCGVECRCDRQWTYLKDVEIENPLPSVSRRLGNR